MGRGHSLTDSSHTRKYKQLPNVWENVQLPVITEMQMTTVEHCFLPAASCEIKTMTLLKAGEGVGRKVLLHAVQKSNLAIGITNP